MRQQAVKAVREGQPVASVASAFGLNVTTVFRWLAKFAEGGQNALLAKPIPGRPPKLSAEEMRWIAQAVKDNTPQQFKFEFGLWTLSLLRGRLLPSFFVKLFIDAHASMSVPSTVKCSPIEQRFGQSFPGRVGRFTDGRREVILRWVASGTRKLHPAGDCFKANGYTLIAQPITVKDGEHWSVFRAERGRRRFEVRERIVDAAGAQWSDVSAWYWAVQLGQTAGPWWAVTVARSADQ